MIDLQYVICIRVRGFTHLHVTKMLSDSHLHVTITVMENLNDQPSQTEMVPERCHQARRKISEKRLVGLDKGFVDSFS